jgi:predicted RNase H-like nuclease (RuvC/YqgF family)
MVVAPSSGHLERYLYYRCDNPLCIKNSAENRAKKRVKNSTYIKASVRAKVIFDFIYDLLKEGLNFTEKEYREYKEGLGTLGDDERQKIRSEIEHFEALRRNNAKEIKRIGLALGKLTENKDAYEINEEALKECKNKQIETEAKIATLREKLTDKDEDELSLEEFLNLSKNASKTVKSGDAIAKDTICRIIFLNLSIRDEKWLRIG